MRAGGCQSLLVLRAGSTGAWAPWSTGVGWSKVQPEVKDHKVHSAVSLLTLWRSHQKTIDCSVIQTARIKVSVDINGRNGPKENCHCTGLVVSGSRCREKWYSSTPDILYFPSLSLFPLWSFPSWWNPQDGPLCSIHSPSRSCLCVYIIISLLSSQHRLNPLGSMAASHWGLRMPYMQVLNDCLKMGLSWLWKPR